MSRAAILRTRTVPQLPSVPREAGAAHPSAPVRRRTRFGSPADSWSPVVLRPPLTEGLPLSSCAPKLRIPKPNQGYRPGAELDKGQCNGCRTESAASLKRRPRLGIST